MSRLSEIMDDTLISVSELARKAGLADNTIRRAATGDGSLRVSTKRKVLVAMNELLRERGVAVLTSSELFGGSHNA